MNTHDGYDTIIVVSATNTLPGSGYNAGASSRWGLVRRPAFFGAATLIVDATNTVEALMVSVGLVVRLVAKSGKEEEVAAFLASALPLAQAESLTVQWFALRASTSVFYIVDSFAADDGRQAHLSGPIAAALMAKASDLLAEPPAIEKVDILASKLPGG